MKKTSKHNARKAKPAKKLPNPKAAAKKQASTSSKSYGKRITGAPIPMMRFQAVPSRPRRAGSIDAERPLIGEPLPSFASKLQVRGFGTRGWRTKEIFFPDERQRVADSFAEPYRWICYLQSESSSGVMPERGTAFLIAPNLALTAAHCLFAESGIDYLTVKLWPAHAGGVPDDAHAVKVSDIYVPQAWLDSNRKQATVDFAALVLEQSLPNGYFSAVHYADADFQNMLLHIAGFPFDRADNSMWEHFGPSTGASSHLISHRIDTRKGQSGAPIFVYHEGNYHAVAIHTGRNGDNHGTRINNEVLDQIDWFVDHHGA